MSFGPPIDSYRVVGELRELDRLTGGRRGAQRLAWGDGWLRARRYLAELLVELGLRPEVDQAGNAWAYLEGADADTVAIGSHLDSVPGGGWLDGALGVFTALGIARAWIEAGAVPPRSIAIVDWADEEGARFGRSLFGSSAVAGTLDLTATARLRDGEGTPIAEVLGAHGVRLSEAARAAERLESVVAFLELHIEQGPLLDNEGYPVAAVAGCAGVERSWFRFSGQAAHAGTTPMPTRRDATLAAFELGLAVERIAAAYGGVGTCGALKLRPGVVTAINGVVEVSVDLRHPSPAVLVEMLGATREAAAEIAGRRRTVLAENPVWRIEPLPFEPELVELARRAAVAANGRAEPLISGALHDAAAISPLVPTAMMFAPSIGGISHAVEEDTREADLRVAIEAFASFAASVITA